MNLRTDSVIYFEVPVDNEDRAREFYSRAFGWTANAMPEINYTLLSTTESDQNRTPKEPGAINGGMFKRGLYGLEHPLVTIRVTSIENTLQSIEKLGGKRMGEKMPVGDMGFAAYFKDSEGNVVGLFQPARM